MRDYFSNYHLIDNYTNNRKTKSFNVQWIPWDIYPFDNFTDDIRLIGK